MKTYLMSDFIMQMQQFNSCSLIFIYYQEDFLDLSLAVAGHLGVKDALSDYYVEEEYLEGKNKYRCEICQKLVNAKKVRCLHSQHFTLD